MTNKTDVSYESFDISGEAKDQVNYYKYNTNVDRYPEVTKLQTVMDLKKKDHSRLLS